MELISREKLILDIENRFCDGCDNANGILCRSCRVQDCLDAIADAPTETEAEEELY